LPVAKEEAGKSLVPMPEGSRLRKLGGQAREKGIPGQSSQEGGEKSGRVGEKFHSKRMSREIKERKGEGALTRAEKGIAKRRRR